LGWAAFSCNGQRNLRNGIFKQKKEPQTYFGLRLLLGDLGRIRTAGLPLRRASQASLPDDTILEYIENGYDIQQIARAMSSDINLIALKVDTLIAQGYQLRKREHQNDFLKYNHKM
jgi:hypothetical protein